MNKILRINVRMLNGWLYDSSSTLGGKNTKHNHSETPWMRLCDTGVRRWFDFKNRKSGMTFVLRPIPDESKLKNYEYLVKHYDGYFHIYGVRRRDKSSPWHSELDRLLRETYGEKQLFGVSLEVPK